MSGGADGAGVAGLARPTERLLQGRPASARDCAYEPLTAAGPAPARHKASALAPADWSAALDERPPSPDPSSGDGRVVTFYRHGRDGEVRPMAVSPHGRPRQRRLPQGLSKVPLIITAYFWIVKGLSTAMGESTSDYLVHRIQPVPAVLLGFAGFAVALTLQFAMRRYLAWTYWFAVVMVGVFGTMGADVLHVGFHVPYFASATLFAIVLAAVFVLWHRSEGTLSIHSITTRRRELFYWAAVVATFALGTAAGDLTAYTLHLGYFSRSCCSRWSS